MLGLHFEIITALEAAAGTANRDQATASYTGSTHRFYAVPVLVRRRIIKTLIRNNQTLTNQDWLVLAEALFLAPSHEEKTMGAMILTYRREARAQVTHIQLKRWLTQLVGWAEVDALCYNIFSAEELLADWPKWEDFLLRLAKSNNVHLRRASLVLLCGPTAHSTDLRLHTVAFTITTQLAPDKLILITKAISWLLRCQIDTNKKLVTAFIQAHKTRLPKIAVREVLRKLETGKKNR